MQSRALISSHTYAAALTKLREVRTEIAAGETVPFLPYRPFQAKSGLL